MNRRRALAGRAACVLCGAAYFGLCPPCGSQIDREARMSNYYNQPRRRADHPPPRTPPPPAASALPPD